MKAIARSYIWWPSIDKEIERTAKSCPGCQLTQREPNTVPVHPWEWPSLPGQQIHINFAGLFLDIMFLVVVDAHSRWLEVERMSSTTSERTIETLQMLSARYGVHYTCQLLFRKMREIFRLHRIWISEDLPTASRDCQRFRKTSKDRWRFPTTSQDFLTTSDNNRRCRKIFDDFKTGPATISKQFQTNLEHY